MQLWRKIFLLSIIFGVLIVSSGCQVDQPIKGSPTQSSEINAQIQITPTTSTATAPVAASTAQPAATPVAPLVPTQAKPPVKTQYRLEAILEYNRHQLTVQEQITYTNSTSESLDNLILMVEPAYYPGTFQLNSLSWGDDRPVTDYTWDGAQIRLNLPASLSPGDRCILRIAYELNLPSPTPSAATRPVPFGYTARQTNLVDWYPFIPPYIPGTGWLAHKAGYFGEHLVYEEADFQVDIQIADQTNSLTIAASAPDHPEGKWHHYQYDTARNFVWSISHQYQVMSTTVGTTQVLGYVFPYHIDAGKTVLQTTAQALALYNQLFGPYPRQTISVVEADFLDGMEYDGLYFLSNGFYNLYTGTPDEYLVAIAAHETAHQWWYASIANDQALEPWLDEALCTYSERIFYEHLYPQALPWWWASRVNYYEPQGWVNGSIYNPDGYRAYRDAVYLNGAVFLEDLRKQIGDSAFYAFLKDYATRYAHHIATAQDFFSVLSLHTQQDLTPLVDRFFAPQ